MAVAGTIGRALLLTLGSLTLLLGLSEVAVASVMLLALRSAQLRRRPGCVTLSGLDGWAAAWGLGAGSVASAILIGVGSLLSLPWGLVAALVAVLLITPFGFGFEVSVTPREATCRRLFLGHVLWRRVPLAEPRAWVDGWGDVADPETLQVGEGSVFFDARDDDAFSFEVGWSGGRSGDRAEQIAAEFNRAVDELRPSPSAASRSGRI